MKLTLDRIIDAGMATFADVGYDGLSMRRVAERLDAHAGSLYYHVRNKSALLRLMSDRVARHAYDAGSEALAALPNSADWQARIHAQVAMVRQSIRQHPGGAVLLAGSPHMLSAGALSLMERLLRTLSDAGVPAGQRIIAADTLLSYAAGFVLQEQSESPTPEVSAQESLDLGERFPMTTTDASRYTEDETFTRSVQLICSAVATLIEPGERAAR